MEELLDSHDAAGGFLETPAVPPRPEDPVAGWQVGPYKTIRELGRGGMGAVYLAERVEEGFRKQVALKVIKRGMDTDEILRRFHTERQILANLEHPHIAHLLDVGSTADGRPFFVMEYVDGLPLHHYCRRHELPTARRLELFRKVCSAVQFAHQNLIVHRDLKPTNILVTEDGTPKLLDFGIAKLLDPGSVGHTVAATARWERLMTPDYASPEQVRGEPVTTASDVYSLGVLLYELLTGCKPYRLEGKEPAEISKALTSQQPPKPSTVIGRTGIGREVTVAEPGAPGEAKEGAEEVKKLRRQLKGDLDNIVMMALHKDPARRYAGAGELSEDLRRHLVGLPVAAREDTPLYLLGKFVTRNKGASLAAVALLVLTVVMTWQRFQIAEERDRARVAQAEAEQTKDLLVGIFEVADPGEAPGETLTAREILERGTERVRAGLQDQPRVRAELLDTVGAIHFQLGLYDQAVNLLQEGLTLRRETLAPDDPAVATSLNHLAEAYLEKGELDDAEAHYRQALERQGASSEGDDLRRAETLTGLALVATLRSELDEAEAWLDQALSLHRRRLGDAGGEKKGDAALALTLEAAVAVEDARGHYEEAIELQRQALGLLRESLGEQHPITLRNLNNLATLHIKEGDYAAARPVLEETLAVHRQVLGNDHPKVATTLRILGSLEVYTGDLERAETLLKEALESDRAAGRLEGYEDALNSLAVVYSQRGNSEAAEAAYRELLASNRWRLGEDHPQTAQMLHNLGMVLLQSGKLEEARPYLERALTIRRGALEADHPDLATSLQSLGLVLLEEGQAAQAEPYFQEALEIRRKSLGNDHPHVAFSLVGLARVHLGQKKPTEAREALEEALTIRRETLPEDHWRIAETQSLLAIAYLDEGRPENAEALLPTAQEALLAARGAEAPETIRATEALQRLRTTQRAR